MDDLLAEILKKLDSLYKEFIELKISINTISVSHKDTEKDLTELKTYAHDNVHNIKNDIAAINLKMVESDNNLTRIMEQNEFKATAKSKVVERIIGGSITGFIFFILGFLSDRFFK